MKWSKLYLVAQRVDMRLGVEGLSQFVQQQLSGQPCDGSAYVFCNSKRNRIKVLVWDGNGVWLCCRRLHRGCFTWIDPQQKQLHLTVEEWNALICGVDWMRLSANTQAHWQM